MQVKGFVWIDDIVEKLKRKHGVHEEEVVEVFRNRPQVRFSEKGHRQGENLYAALGRTDEGRYLTIFFVHKSDKRALIVSARGMSTRERKRYEQG